MAKLSEVFNIERDRQDKDKWNKIHLFKMGDFYRAYEWSAWLICVITYTDEARMKTKDRKPLKKTRIAIANSDDTYCFVGFPIKSVEKFIPERENFETEADKHVIITITMPTPADGSEVTYERLKTAFTTWKDAIEIKERDTEEKSTTKKETVNSTSFNQQTTIGGNGIISQILAYPLDQRTSIENIEFISSLKRQVASIL